MEIGDICRYKKGSQYLTFKIHELDARPPAGKRGKFVECLVSGGAYPPCFAGMNRVWKVRASEIKKVDIKVIQ